MSVDKDTTNSEYTCRIIKEQRRYFKHFLKFINPYAVHIKKVCRGEVLDIGCGIGRNLEYLGHRAMGIDHNKESVTFALFRGFNAAHTSEIKALLKNKLFDTFLIAHVLEHMNDSDSINLIKDYLPFLKDNGQIVVICPQERGFKHDPTHLNFVKFNEIENVVYKSGMSVIKKYSFPFPRFMGKYWVFNEFVVIAERNK